MAESQSEPEAASVASAPAVPAAEGAAPVLAEQSSTVAPASSPAPDTAAATAAPTAADAFSIDDLLKQASFEDPTKLQEAVAAASAAAGLPIPEGSEFKLPNFQQAMRDAAVSSIDLLRDVELNVKIELGRSHMMVEDVLKLAEGSVVELDKLAGDPVDVFVNDRLVARGEVLVLNDNFCVRVNEIVAGAKEEAL